MTSSEKIGRRRKKTEPILIFPFNGNAIEAVDCLNNEYHLIAFVDDERTKQKTDFEGHSVLSRAAFTEYPESFVLAVPGGPESFLLRRGIIEGLNIGKERFACVLHPKAEISKQSSIGHNFLAMAGVVITSNAIIGNHVCILPNTVVHHDATIGDWTLIGSNVSVAGGVRIGENCYIGSGSCIKNGVSIGAGSLIGLGSAVIRDVPDNATVVGNPAREIT
jgi:sugar O-acyltransferase (sialic acid O-acetyltransferase NeuD family)